ncbi:MULTISPECIES: phage holin family protein [unclassified Sphingomonas]|uniref:phage holin family protein n=1 Tax=unclassified Sphingomonas TaxID=196159 RepID=UPI001F56E1EF|nr:MULTISPECIES: phage holin family protein [unclassified Sphingomonas]
MSEILKNAGPASADDSVATLLSRAMSDVEEVARAEIELRKATLFAKVDEAKAGVVLLVAAAIIGLLALIGLVVGVLMILTPLVGPIWATVIVVGVLLVVAGVLGMMGIGHFKRMSAVPEVGA